jgi:hypothetical protein
VLRLRGFWLAAAGIVFAVLALGVVEGVLPLHLATLLTQAQIGALYVAMSLASGVGVKQDPTFASPFYERQRSLTDAKLPALLMRTIDVWIDEVLVTASAVVRGRESRPPGEGRQLAAPVWNARRIAGECRRAVADAGVGGGAGTRDPARAAQAGNHRSGPEVQRPPQPRL